MKTIKIIGKMQPLIVDTSPRSARVDPALVAQALGAEIVSTGGRPGLAWAARRQKIPLSEAGKRLDKMKRRAAIKIIRRYQRQRRYEEGDGRVTYKPLTLDRAIAALPGAWLDLANYGRGTKFVRDEVCLKTHPGTSKLVTTRIPADLKKAIAEAAAADNRSVTSFTVSALYAALSIGPGNIAEAAAEAKRGMAKGRKKS